MKSYEVDGEQRIDSVDREDIWQKAQNDWLESLKSEDTPIERRIIDYESNGWGINESNTEKIKIDFRFSVTPVDPENTEWNIEGSNVGFLEMTNVDGEYKVDYISDKPKNYDKFMEEFEKWKNENSQVETTTVQGQTKELTNLEEAKKIDKITIGIIFLCVTIITVIVVSFIRRKIKRRLG